jgi:glutathione S-transferase
MSLTLYFHPLSSFCHKALIALYENGTRVQAAARQFHGSGRERRVQGDVADPEISASAR